ncbi:MAG: hypothetical protein ED559_05165 [Phycisphaera sp.]|nr:MAG: hypothetical protein ED559_05165 [Phycisphaera sp.]
MDDSYDSGTGFVHERTGQFYYGDGGIDDACYRRIDANADADYTDSTDSHWYLLRDIQGSVVAVVDETGALHERVHYDPWGQARYSWPGDFDGDGDGDVDATDGGYYTALTLPVAITNSSYNADLDLDFDGDIDLNDQTLFNTAGYKSALPAGSVSDRTGPDNPFGYASYLHRPETNLYLARHRHYDPIDGRWISRDPLIYRDGMNLYQYVRSNPSRFSDSSGLHTDDSYDSPSNQERLNNVEEAMDKYGCKGNATNETGVGIGSGSGAGAVLGITAGSIGSAVSDGIGTNMEKANKYKFVENGPVSTNHPHGRRGTMLRRFGSGLGGAATVGGAAWDGYWIVRHLDEDNHYSAAASGVSLGANAGFAMIAGSLSTGGAVAIVGGIATVGILTGELASQLDENAKTEAVNNDANRNGQCMLYERARKRLKCKIEAEERGEQ